MKENPYELLYMYRMGDRYAEKRLYTIYKPYAEMVVRTFLKKNEYLRGYEEDLSPSAAADAPLRLELSWEKDGAAPGLVRSRIRVSASGSNEPLYTLETAAGKEAAS